jgi:FMN-dependent NADH-azoreductase
MPLDRVVIETRFDAFHARHGRIYLDRVSSATGWTRLEEVCAEGRENAPRRLTETCRNATNMARHFVDSHYGLSPRSTPKNE